MLPQASCPHPCPHQGGQIGRRKLQRCTRTAQQQPVHGCGTSAGLIVRAQQTQRAVASLGTTKSPKGAEAMQGDSSVPFSQHPGAAGFWGARQEEQDSRPCSRSGSQQDDRLQA